MATLEITEFKLDRITSIIINCLALEVEDLQAIYEHAVKAGGQIVREPWEEEDSIVYLFN